MNIISVDLLWKEDKRERRILAIADLDGNVRITQASDDNEPNKLRVYFPNGIVSTGNRFCLGHNLINKDNLLEGPEIDWRLQASRRHTNDNFPTFAQ